MPGEAPAAGLGCIAIIMFMMFLVIPLSLITIWIWMLIYCIKHQRKDRTAWLLVTIMGGPLGSIIYFFIKDKKVVP